MDNTATKKKKIKQELITGWENTFPKKFRDKIGTIYDDIVDVYIPIYYKNRTPIIVYQMGKVGSRTVVDSLMDYGLSAVFHSHSMNLQYIRKKQRKFKSRSPPYGNAPEHKKDKIFRKILINGKRKLKVITLVREPIVRNISSFFENIEKYVPKEDLKEDLERLQKDFFENFDRHDRHTLWFDREIKKVLDIDIYEYDFPKEKGYQTIEEDSCELLILKLEMPDEKMEKAIIDFLDLDDDFILQRSNVGEEKEYAEFYQKFKENVELPQSYIDKILNSKYTKHFYTEEEIQDVRERLDRKEEVDGNE